MPAFCNNSLKPMVKNKYQYIERTLITNQFCSENIRSPSIKSASLELVAIISCPNIARVIATNFSESWMFKLWVVGSFFTFPCSSPSSRPTSSWSGSGSLAKASGWSSDLLSCPSPGLHKNVVKTDVLPQEVHKLEKCTCLKQ